MARDQGLIEGAKAMRSSPSPAEQMLWWLLRAQRRLSAKFSRQVVIGSYIVDLAARSAKLVVEIDGDSHDYQVEYDARRTTYLERQGYRVIRFRNRDVMQSAEGVLHVIGEALTTPPLAAARCAAVLAPAGGGRAE